MSPHVFRIVIRGRVFSQSFGFCGPFIMYEHVVEHLLCIAVPQAHHSTVQSARAKPQSRYVPIRVRQRKQPHKEHLLCIAVPQAQPSTAQSARTKPSISTCRPECDNASKLTELARAESQHVRRAFIQHAKFSKRTNKSNLQPTKYSPSTKYTTRV